MITLSKAAQEAMWGDEAILRYLDTGREHYERGEHDALIEVVFLCARFQAVIPDWAADALLATQRKLAVGDARDFNGAFGWDGEGKAKRQRDARQSQLEKDVLVEMQCLRLDGATFSPEDMFPRVQEALAVRGTDASIRDIRAIYQRRGAFLKDLPTSPDGTNYAIIHSTIEIPRRKGRGILRDAEE